MTDYYGLTWSTVDGDHFVGIYDTPAERDARKAVLAADNWVLNVEEE